MTAIRCTRVDPPAKPGREELLLSVLQECPRSGMGWEQVVKHVETALTAWEADTPAPTYRIDLDAEAFEALKDEIKYDGNGLNLNGPDQRPLVHDALMRVIWRCANGPKDGDLANAVMADAYADPEQRAWIEAQQAEALTNPGPPDDMEAIRALIAEQDDEGPADAERIRRLKLMQGSIGETVDPDEDEIERIPAVTMAEDDEDPPSFIATPIRWRLVATQEVDPSKAPDLTYAAAKARVVADLVTALLVPGRYQRLDEFTYNRLLSAATALGHKLPDWETLEANRCPRCGCLIEPGTRHTPFNGNQMFACAIQVASEGQDESLIGWQDNSTQQAGTAGASAEQGDASDRYADIGDRTKDGVVIRFEPGFGLNVYIEVVKHQGGRSEVYKSVGLSDTGWEKVCDAVDEWRRRNDNAPNRCPGYTVTAEELAQAMDLASHNDASSGHFWWVSIATSMLARFFPEHIAKPAVAEPVAVERCGGLILDGYGSRCVRPKGHPPIDGIGCRRIWCPEDGPEPTEPVVYGGDGTVPR